ncbi:DUF4097 domain-containing protein [Actinomadura soli]|uniref:DUF4097 domain-containing protein n=1 Tax=Actinomadura soli TaxID=2508997 RepID=A0A5C4JFM7_9ACTN|nr:DUF4097 family beta strand repeat-containing protein [Actinomadura soli]TMR03014.1 DUF4097 domain-containing protein [Actinomadura soli]
MILRSAGAAVRTPPRAPITTASGASGASAVPGRPRRRGIWIFLAIVTALVLVIPAGLTAWGRAIRQTTTSVTPYRHAITELRLDAGGAEVSVGPGPDGEAHVYKRLSWGVRKPDTTEAVVGGVLFVTFRCNGSGLVSGRECGADIDVRVPRGTRVSAATGSGRISVRGLSGDLDLRTGSGEVRAADVRGRLRLRARSGAVVATGLASPEVKAEVSSGLLDLRFAEPPGAVEARAASGTIKVIVPPGSVYRVTGWTGSGSAHLNKAVLDDASPRRISVHSGSGATYLDYRDEE